MQIGADVGNLVLPYAVYRGRESFGVSCGDSRQCGIEDLEHPIHGRRRHRHLSLLQSAKEFSQHLVKQTPLREGVHALERLGFLERFEMIERRKEKSVRTVSV